MTTDRDQSAKRAERAWPVEGFFADEVDEVPSPQDPYNVRAAWARKVVEEGSAQAMEQRSARVALPDDIRPSHFWEVEFQSALVDPIAYANSMRAAVRVLN